MSETIRSAAIIAPGGMGASLATTGKAKNSPGGAIKNRLVDAPKDRAAAEQDRMQAAQARLDRLAASRAYQKKATLSPIRTNPVVASQLGPTLGTSSYSTSRKLLGG